MPDQQQQETSMEVSNPTFGSLKIRGTDWVCLGTLILLIAVAVGGYSVNREFNVKQDLQNATMVTVLKELADTQREANKQGKLLACIVSRPEPERRREFESDNSFCQRFAR